jgi:YggT family protein
VLQLLLCRAAQAYLFVIFARVVISWFPVAPGSAFASVYSFLYAITEPVLGPIRRIIPPMGVGGMGMDFSPIIVILVLTVLQQAVCS